MTAFNIIKTMTRKGNVVLGSGCYAAAISCKNNDATVIKVGNNVNDPWLHYKNLVIDTMLSNPHVPTAHKFYIDRDSEYYIAVLDKLYPISYHNTEAYQAVEVCNSYLKRYIDDAEFLHDAKSLSKCIPNPSVMLYALNKIAEYTDYVCKGVIPEEDLDRSLLVLDLHNGNYMLRESGELVINDPWCDGDMSQIVDVSEWVDRSASSTSSFY